MDLENLKYCGSNASTEEQNLAGPIPSPTQSGFLNRFNNVYDYEVHRDNTSVAYRLLEIRGDKNLYKENILRARAIGKYASDGSINPGYDKIKCALPCVSWNFRFDRRRTNENVTCSTGYLYFDIDKEGFTIDRMDKSKIFACWSSLSNIGKSVLVRVSGITSRNFECNYTLIAQDLGIEEIIDLGSKKIVQANVLSYDPGIYINYDSHVYMASEPEQVTLNNKREAVALVATSLIEEEKVQDKKVSSGTNIREEKKKKYIRPRDTFFRYSNIDAYVENDGFKSYKEGVPVICLYLPATISRGKRRRTLLPYCNDLVFLNPDIEQEEIQDHIMYRNSLRCSPPLEEKEIRYIVNLVFKAKVNGILKPRGEKVRKVLFGSKCGMDKHDKQSYSAKMGQEWKKEDTRQLIYDTIEACTAKKITAKKIASEAGLGIATVKRYWSELKEFVKSINEERK